MTVPTTKQPAGVAIASAPQETVEAATSTTPTVLAKLAALRETYLQELLTAREKVKKNFLR